MPYRTMRWIVFVLAGGFDALMHLYLEMPGNRQAQWFSLTAELVLILFFTLGVFHQLEVMDRRMRQHQARSTTLFESSGLGILVISPGGVISEANRSAALLTGWDRGELTGRKACTELFHCEEMRCAGLCPDTAKHEAMPAEDGLISLTLRHKSGRSIPVMASVASLPGDLPDGATQPGDVAFFVWDVSERVRLEAEAARRRRQAEGLTEIGREIAAFTDLNRSMGRVLSKARDLFGLDLVAWGTLDEVDGTLTLQSASGLAEEKFTGTVLPSAGDPMCESIQAGRTYVVTDPAAHTHACSELAALFANPDFRCTIAVPFRVRENTYGILLGASLQEHQLPDEELLLFTHLAGYVATAVENGYLLAEVQHIATLEERQRLAREMHDSFGQTLTYLGMRMHMIAKAAQKGDTELIMREAADLRQVLQETHADVRQSIFQLKEDSPSHAPMSSRWEQLLKGFEQRTGIQVHFQTEGVLPRLPEEAQAQLTRILQEAIANVRNHAGADSVTVRLERSGRTLQLQIRDDGAGFDPQQAVGPVQHHFGLTIMKERAAAIGAQLQIRSQRGDGTTVTVQMPLASGEG